MTRFPPFEVTRSAINELEAVGGSVRVCLVPGGCCGTGWWFEAALPGPDDEQYGCEGAWLAVDEAALPLLTGAKLDFGPALKPPRFRVINNPNTPVRCPCRRSFGEPFPGQRTPHCLSREPMPWDRPDR